MALKSGRVGIHPSQVDPITGMLLSSPGGASDLSDLDDVSIDNPEAGQLLIYDGDKWENQFASISPVTPATLASLQDVRIDTPEVGQQLIYNGNKWENQFASISPLSLAQLHDVEITDLQDGDFITYDSTSEKWVNTGEAPGPTVIHQTVTVYSAVEDVISYTDIYGATQTEAFAANSDHKTITVDIYESGSNITFTSSVAKNPNSLSDAYSKTVTITNATSDVYVMPDNALYWYGYISSNCETCNATNGWSGNYSYAEPTYNKNNVSLSTTSSQYCGIGTKNTVSATRFYGIAIKTSGEYAHVMASKATTPSKNTSVDVDMSSVFTSSMSLQSVINTKSPTYASLRFAVGASGTAYALWYE